LFGPEWKVTSIWTTLTVPWTLDYHDTHFAFTLTKPGPVVIVLSQLDDRYFRGLEGQYRFDLAFRLHKADQEDYVVRSSPGYRQNRSVNVELELEAGQYTVLVKIDAMRNDKILPVDQVIKNNAKERREKLIRIGLAYDLAHSKGKISETPEEKVKREAHEQRKKEKDRAEIKKKILEERERAHYMKTKRIKKQQKRQAKMRAKRKVDTEKRRRNGGGFRFGGGGPPPPPPTFKVSKPKKEKGSEKADDGKGAEGKDKPAEKHVTIQLPGETVKEATKECDSGTDQGEKTPSSTGSDKSSASTPDQAKEEVKPGGESSGTSTSDQKTETEKPETSGEAKQVDGKPKAGDEEKNPEGSPKESRTTEGSGKDAGNTPNGDDTKESKETMKTGDDAEDTDKAASNASGSKASSDAESICESESDSDMGSVSSLSDLSERELDMQIELRKNGIGRMSLPPPPPPNLADEQDEFERDPWNAVAVVGVRIYYKVGDEDKPNEMVKLRVVRPYLYDEEEGEEGEKKDKDSQEIKTKGLDVDDSAKDATLEGDPAARKKSIVPDDGSKAK
jgi:hypothetical protein